MSKPILGARIITVTKIDAVPTLTEIRKETEIKQAEVIKSKKALIKGCDVGMGSDSDLVWGGPKQGLSEELKLTLRLEDE